MWSILSFAFSMSVQSCGLGDLRRVCVRVVCLVCVCGNKTSELAEHNWVKVKSLSIYKVRGYLYTRDVPILALRPLAFVF